MLQVDLLSIANAIIGLFNFGKLANDILQNRLREMKYKDIILDYKDKRDLGLRKGAIQCIDKAIIENSSNNKICAQLYTLKGTEIFLELSEEIMLLICMEKDSRGDKDVFSKSDSVNIIFNNIFNSDKIHNISEMLLQALECAIKLDPTYDDAWKMKNLALFLNGKWKEAIKSIETTLQIAGLDDEEIAKLLVLKAWLCYIFDDIGEALECLSEVITMGNNDSRSFKNAFIFYQLICEQILKR